MKLDPLHNFRSARPRAPISRFVLCVGAACAALGLASPMAMAQSKPIRIGVPTAVQLQVGRDTQDGVKMAIDDINAKGESADGSARACASEVV